ncbi:hypothetical protein CEXT_201261 [Caerostris extrusa]|uniref:Ribosomal protein S10 n=1 Tax=Caerostris extrusa TaxID=172846 RepID=A0AAV4MCZ6_CAEEX|nr:hypothetical protein CEXT_201261 [Caerostris extrusa]
MKSEIEIASIIHRGCIRLLSICIAIDNTFSFLILKSGVSLGLNAGRKFPTIQEVLYVAECQNYYNCLTKKRDHSLMGPGPLRCAGKRKIDRKVILLVHLDRKVSVEMYIRKTVRRIYALNQNMLFHVTFQQMSRSHHAEWAVSLNPLNIPPVS